MANKPKKYRSMMHQFHEIFPRKGHFCPFGKKGRGLDPQDPPYSCAPDWMGILKTVELADLAEKNAKRIRILKTVGLGDFAEKNAKRMAVES